MFFLAARGFPRLLILDRIFSAFHSLDTVRSFDVLGYRPNTNCHLW